MNTTPGKKYIDGVNDFSTVPAYKSLAEKISARGKELIETMQVEFTEQDPYKNSKEMREDLKKGMIKIFTGGDKHPVFTKEENNMFRLVHDVDGHGLDLGFSLKDEIATYSRMVEKLFLEGDEARALYTEIVGQVTAYYMTGEYQEQKILFIN